MLLENLQRAPAPARRDAAILLTALCAAALLLPSPAAAQAASRPPGPLLGRFALEPIPLPALKRSAADRPVPAAGAAQAMARVGKGFQSASLAPYGWRLVAESLGFATLEGDPAMLPLLRALAGTPDGPPGLLELRPARPVTGAMAAARRLSRVDGVLDFGPAPVTEGVSGKGVLIGILDYGFDVLHPDLVDSAGRIRFLGVWDPNKPKAPGAPFNRGQVKWRAGLEADPDFAQNPEDMHGTNVTSIAAGSDPAGSRYGVAPRATLLGVNLSTPNDSVSGETDIMQGIQWIFSVADSLDLPCVVNLSLGNQHVGPHDGTSLFDRFLDSVSRAGRIVVGAAGNDGAKRLHARLPLATGDTTGTWCVAPGMVDLWGEAGKQFRVQVLIMDTASGAWMAQTDFLSTANGTGRMVGDSVDWIEPGTGRRVPLLILARPERSAPENGRPHMELMVQPGSEDTARAPRGLRMGFRITGTGVVNAWNANLNAFVTAGLPDYVGGDNDMSVSEIAGTARRIVSAGAYVSANNYRDYKGVEHPEIAPQPVGEAAEWSSRGPTLDGRVKPDIAAPGRMVVGALSRAGVNLHPWMYDRIVEWPNPPSLAGRYAVSEGTSVSSPIVAGTVALLLEIDPGLTPEEVRSILTRTAYKDAFTGPLATPDAAWGYGKLDAGAAVRELKDVPAGVPGGIARAARPPSARFLGGNLRVTGMADAGTAAGDLFDWRGRRIARLESRGAGLFAVRAGLPGPGVYIAVLRSPSGVHRLRVYKD